jgi:transcriptional regulator with XRE-family HTH domain
MMSSSTIIKKIRLNLCLEQEQFANILGISKSAIYNYEKGHRTPRLRIIKKLREIAKENGMEFSVEDFLNELDD